MRYSSIHEELIRDVSEAACVVRQELESWRGEGNPQYVILGVIVLPWLAEMIETRPSDPAIGRAFAFFENGGGLGL